MRSSVQTRLHEWCILPASTLPDFTVAAQMQEYPVRSTLTDPTHNQLINALPVRLRADFLEQCTPIYLLADAVPGENGIDTTHAYFPVDGIVCLRISLAVSKTLDVAMIGNEGMYGIPLWYSGSTKQLEGLVRQSGNFLRMDLSLFQQHLTQSPELRATMDHCITVLLEQVARTAVCVCFHDVRSRLATFLLMMQDRTQRNDMQLTHRCLADIMGVRRSAVSIAANTLQKEQLIRYARGNIHLVSREGMEMAACECYRTATSSVAH